MEIMLMKVTLALLSLGLIAAAPVERTLTGTVVAVPSGDTFALHTGRQVVRVRLAEVDAPEPGQVFGDRARQFTERMILGRRVKVNVVMVDRFGRWVGEVIVEDGRVLNEELVRAGWAWYYRVHPIHNRRLHRMEQYAFAGKLGLWVEKDPLPPWEFRREARIPPAPESLGQVDYDQIFHYGIVGDLKTKTVRWPACKQYRARRPKQALIFHDLHQARTMGFQPAKDCPR